jgi:hypothetical protein
MSPQATASARFLADINAPIVGLQVDKAFSQLKWIAVTTFPDSLIPTIFPFVVPGRKSTLTIWVRLLGQALGSSWDSGPLTPRGYTTC